jgi:glucose-1-phosphate adenylyltransferase
MPLTENILAVILGGGVGKRLYPLTKHRAKPAVPIAGKYRLIDVPISNCINSKIHHVAVLTQFNSASLHRHITQTYQFDDFHRGWVQILAAEQTPRSSDWYQGTADAVRKQMLEIRAANFDYVLILAGDHLYRMDYERMADFHQQNRADITVAVQPIAGHEASRFGLLKRESDGHIVSFVEKPRDPNALSEFVSRNDPERPYIGSMGLYLFSTNILEKLLQNTLYSDFGGQVIPNSLQEYAVYGFDFEGYWEDIGTIRSFYETNLRLASPDTPFTFYDPVRPIYTRPRYLPGSIAEDSFLNSVLLAEGCQIVRSKIEDSIVGLRGQIRSGVRMKRTIFMGADYYDPPSKKHPSGIPLGIGANCSIEGAILDKNVRLGEGVIIRPFPPGTELDRELYAVQDGIVIVPKDTVLPSGTKIEPVG